MMALFYGRSHHHFVSNGCHSIATVLLLLFLASASHSIPLGNRRILRLSQDTKGLVNFFHVEMRLGSSPPTCRYKCGRCYPCKAVNVPIHPGMSMPLEYYPEAWRCKCGNKLYMP